MIIKNIRIEKFRGFKDAEFELGENLTVIAGQNGTQKTTLLGMLSQPFSISDKDHPLYSEKPLCGGNYRSGFAEKFKLSESFDKPKTHEWTLSLKKDDAQFTLESMPRSRSTGDIIRFWRKGDRTKGSGYIPTPVIYLSLSRLFPIGEDQDIGSSNDVVLTQDEVEFYSDWHNRILIIPDTQLTSIDYLSSTQKKTIGANTSHYDWKMNSAGQDNIGKILLAILSFRRLKEKHGASYTGGVLAIDELDATLYPASQVKLFNALRKFSSQYDIQIVFTTHSLNILENACQLQDETKLKNQVKVVFLRKINDQIKIIQNADFDLIRSMLNNVLLDDIPPRKIRIFTEDKEGELFCKVLMGHRISGASFIDCTFGSDNLIELINKRVPGFRESESITVLDGDINADSAKLKKIKKHPHIIILPGQLSPERLLAKYLHSIDDDAPEWNKIKNGYRKQIAFGDVQLKDILRDRKQAKEWFISQQKYWGRNCAKMIGVWRDSNRDACNEFVSKFEEILKKYN